MLMSPRALCSVVLLLEGYFERDHAKNRWLAQRIEGSVLPLLKTVCIGRPMTGKKVLFSDESKYCLFGSDGMKYVRRPINTRFHPKYQVPTVKHDGGNAMV